MGNANCPDTPRFEGTLRPPPRETGRMSSECRECLAGLGHCHGTVIHHATGRTECTEPGCETPEVVHAFTVDCDAVGCACDVTVAMAV